MAYRLDIARGLKSEVRRVARAQLQQAIDELAAPLTHMGRATPQRARPRIKKALAALRLLEPEHTRRARRTRHRLARAARLIGEVADADALLDTLAAIGESDPRALPPAIISTLGVRLEQRRRRALRRAQIERKVEAAAALLREERKRVRRAQFGRSGFRAVAPQLRQSMQAAQDAHTIATHRPSLRHYHVWRNRVKTLWLQVRLIDQRCGGHLGAMETRLAALDACLGEYHNCGLLADLLAHGWLASRPDTAACLHAIRRHQNALRDRAARLARPLAREQPGAFIKRVRRHWRGRGETQRVAERARAA